MPEGYPTWTFDYEAEQKKAFEKLRAYYEKMLNLAKGDVDLAKRMIAFDYEQGLRESRSEFELKQREQAITFPGEREAFWAGAGQRGIVGEATVAEPGGGLIGKEIKRLTESQAIRKEAIDRALEFKETRLEKGKGFGFEKEERGLERETQKLGKEHQKESIEMAMNRMRIEQAKYGAKAGEWAAEEQVRARKEPQKVEHYWREGQGY